MKSSFIYSDFPPYELVRENVVDRITCKYNILKFTTRKHCVYKKIRNT